MSVSSNIRKESTESHAAQQMHSTMGTDPNVGQLNDKNLDNELPSRLNDQANGTSVAEDVEEIDDVIAEADDTNKPTHVADADWNRSTEE
ncbi:hypothetical protein [Fibrella forsythiae]|uniref:Uncharacterized protein n=1 Tax=Fibrella forsythiae TaxID=2817061 RepID=A0ABS3JPW1_9BACT|nr:hypothetical protein [Fibrella forsythiae]MBO0952039.1 hypothetical protein [Fibrella forsythiae]